MKSIVTAEQLSDDEIELLQDAEYINEFVKNVLPPNEATSTFIGAEYMDFNETYEWAKSLGKHGKLLLTKLMSMKDGTHQQLTVTNA
jgi:hypothetical protein